MTSSLLGKTHLSLEAIGGGSWQHSGQPCWEYKRHACVYDRGQAEPSGMPSVQMHKEMGSECFGVCPAKPLLFLEARLEDVLHLEGLRAK